MATKPPTLRILCFGASITAGFHHFGLSHHPYAKRLTQRLQTALPSSKITIDIDALSGDRVIGGQYSTRLKTHFGTTTSAKNSSDYDWIIFQGGGNDLGWGKEPTAIFEEMKKLWGMCVSGGAKVMALTVTETSDQSRGTRERYGKLNGLIRDYRREGFFVADVEKKVPYGSMDPELRRKVWDDGLHFKPLGYDMIGDAVADRLLEVLKVEHSPQEKL
ncbi:MAG: hypothetical protein Q9208_001867 [Pyrenodesmia sp. 3 TL-2023]